MPSYSSSDEKLSKLMGSLGFTIKPGQCSVTPLTGGVSADIHLFETPSGPVVVKQALEKLRVSEAWEVPVSRNQQEVAWLKTVAVFAPTSVPRVLASDSDAGLFVMEYLPPEANPVWKTELAMGKIDPDFAAEVASLLARIHSRTAGSRELAATFDTDELFLALRPAPYFLAAAAKHPELASTLEQLTASLFDNKKALVHGDISPKNILHSASGPVLLDAECAWYGDPAFDLAFCLTHLLLKTLWQPQWSEQYLACFEALASTYLKGVDWESPNEIEQRISLLLPALLLGRIDGKSPVEYITQESSRDWVRTFAKQLLLSPVKRLTQVHDRWAVNTTQPHNT